MIYDKYKIIIGKHRFRIQAFANKASSTCNQLQSFTYAAELNKTISPWMRIETNLMPLFNCNWSLRSGVNHTLGIITPQVSKPCVWKALLRLEAAVTFTPNLCSGQQLGRGYPGCSTPEQSSPMLDSGLLS